MIETIEAGSATSPSSGVLSLLHPRSVAVVGASDRKDSLGYAVLSNLLEGEFQGPVYPISLHEESVLGLPAHASLEDVEGPVELAVVAIPAAGIRSVLESCVRKGIRNVVILSAGFKESGAAGKAQEAELRDYALQHGLCVLGPNSLGMMNPGLGLNATFAKHISRPGNVSLISQSGAIGVYALEFAASRGLGFSKFLSLGNKALLNESHVLEALSRDPSTEVVLAYLEDFQSPAAFFAAAKKMAESERPKPLLLVKAGTGQSGRRAAASHTGAMAQASEFLPDLCEQHGVLLMESLEAMFEAAECLSAHELPKGSRLGVVTNAGGPAILAADAAERLGLVLPELSPAARERLKPHLPPSAGTANPVDVLGDGNAERFGSALDVLIPSGEVDSLLVICTPQRMTDLEAVARALGDRAVAARARGIPLIAVFARFESGERFEQILADRGVPCYAYPESGIRALAAAVRVSGRSARLRRAAVVRPEPTPPGTAAFADLGTAARIVSAAVERGREALDALDVRALLDACGFSTPASGIARTRADLAALSATLKFPVAVKIVSSEVSHKSDVGGVVTGVRDPAELDAAYDAVRANFRKARREREPEGVLVQEMVTDGVETIFGAVRDPDFGPILLFGAGGTAVEILHDVKFRRAPITPFDAEALIGGLRSSALLGRFRGRPERDLPALKECLFRLSRLMVEIPEIREIDLNPVFAREQGAIVADARVFLASRNPSTQGGIS